ncbi:ornithine cyclodeaminase family protein [Egicoccus sp. AB-alg6-2]|uniref:ornithine cyclodeaminase family protein n=1 Tax=Egicoccus sp. AB-alg6-2 TaxID=3242692 RepID=UPI00359E0842
MTLIIDNDAVEQVLGMGACIEALDTAFRAYASGGAVNRPRSHTYTDLGDGHHYLFKSMDGAIADLGVHAIRLSSDLTHEFERGGRRRRTKIPAAPGGRYVGMVLLFDIATLVPLAIIQDGYLQRMRVGATSALAARHLAAPRARRVGLIGTGWQAGAQLLGLHERGDITDYRVYSPNETRCRSFCEEFTARLGVEVRPVRSARDAVEGADIVALATNSHDPVIDATWLQPGQHVGSVQGGELDDATLERADVIGVRSREEATFHYATGHAPVEAANRKRPAEHIRAKMVELGDVVTGRAGRTAPEQLTLFTGGGTGASSGLGIQFTAVAHAVYEAVCAAGGGREVPTEWFTQVYKP